MEILDIILIFLLGYAFGQIILAYKIAKNISKQHMLHPEYNIIDYSAKNSNIVRRLKTESVDNTIFLYDDSNMFICQANTLEDLAKLSKEYKNIDYAVVIHGEEIFRFVHGVIAKVH